MSSISISIKCQCLTKAASHRWQMRTSETSVSAIYSLLASYKLRLFNLFFHEQKKEMHQSFRFDPSIRTHSIPHMNNTTTTDNYSMIESVDSVDGGDTAAAAAATATTLHLPSIYSSNNSGSSNSRYSQSKKG